MNKKTETSTHSASAESQSSDGPENQENVDKIRDILFGGHMRDYDKRFHNLEDRLAKEISRLSDDIDAKFERLDKFMKQEFKTLGEKLVTERKERTQDTEDSAAALAEARKTIENRIADVDEVHSAAAQEMRTTLHEQANEMLDTIRKNQESGESNLRNETRRLGDEKVAREDLAGLFTEVALRLQREFDMPDDS